jgi:thymidylate kinase
MPHSPAESVAGISGSRLHPLLEAVFGAWSRDRIPWSVLWLPEDTFAPDSDIDLLIDSVNMDAAAALAEDHGFVRLPGQHRGLHLIAFDARLGVWLWLHCVGELAFGPNQALRGDPAGILLQRRDSSWPPRLSAADEFWITLAHCLLDRQKVAAKHRQRLTSLSRVSPAGGVIPEGLQRLLPNGVRSADLLDACRTGDWQTLDRLIPGLVEQAVWQSRGGVARRTIRFAQRLRRRLTNARVGKGMSVALLGPDGAGKSTLAAGIQERFVFPVRQVYMGLTGGALPRVDRLRLPGLVRAGRLTVIWGRYLRAQYHVMQGRVVVFDRYIYDAAVPTPFPLSLGKRIGRWIDGHSCPSPDVVLLLDAPGATMHHRKPSYTPEMIENWRQHFLALHRRLPHLEVIDTTKGTAEVLNHAMSRLWQEYIRRWRRDQRR